MIEVTVLGSGTGFPSARRGSPSVLVRAGGRTILVDAGPGALRAAAAAGAGPGEVDAVLLTHFHPDHLLDVPALLFALRHPSFAGRRPLTLAAPSGFDAILAHWLGAPYGSWLRPETFRLSVQTVVPGPQDLLGLPLTAVPVAHAPESLAYRISETPGGAVLAVSGDTGPCVGAVEAGRGAGLYLLECAFRDPAPWNGHLTPSTAAAVAAAAGPGRLVLTHFYPEVESEPVEEIVNRTFRGPAERARDGAVYRVG